MKNILNKHLNLILSISLCLLIIFGFYKNGILVYQKGYISLLEMFKPLLLVSICIGGAALGSFISEHKNSKKIKLEYLSKLKEVMIESAILACTLPISTSPLVLFIVVLLFYTIFSGLKINKVALLFILISIINVLLKTNAFENAYELTTKLNYGSLDLFLGTGIGGIASTSIFLVALSLFVLSFNKLYKRDIAFFSIIIFVMATLIIAIITNNYSEIFRTLFSNGILFSFVFVSPIIYSSCYTVKGQVLSGIIIGILTVILSFFVPHLAVFLAILFVSLIKNIIDRIYTII